MANRSQKSDIGCKSNAAMSDKINVAIRVRPLINRETHGGFRRSNWKVFNNESIYQIDSSGKMTGNSYSFDVIFDQDRNNEDIFREIAVPVVDSCVDGFHGTIFVYGQTSSGKTYTMTGTNNDSGLIPRSVDRIFDTIDTSYDREFLLRASYMEIYNEKICDLLAKEQKMLSIKENYDGQLYVQNLEEIPVSSKEGLLGLMRQGDVNRRTGETNMNEKSSRSHSIFRLIIESQVKGQDGSAVKVSHFNLVDLAGSERLAQTGATGERLREGCHINKSLSTLSLVIYKLSVGDDFVNYRDSKLTRILQGALGGNSRTSIICTVTPASIDETHSTLKFATNAKVIKNKPIVNEVLTDAAMLKRYEKEINKLKGQLGNMDSMKMLSDDEWRALQENLELKDQEKKQLANRISKLQTEILTSQSQPRPVEVVGFKQKAKRRETCCLGLLPKKQVNLLPSGLPSSGEEFKDFMRPKSILPPPPVVEEFVSAEVAFASLPTESLFAAPAARRMSFSPPRGRKAVVLFDPVVTPIPSDSSVIGGIPGQCDCGPRMEELEEELEYLREENEKLQNVNEMMISEIEMKKDFSMLEKDFKQMSPATSLLLSPAPKSRRKSLARTLLSPAARSFASPATSRLEKYMSPRTMGIKSQLEAAIAERDDARQEIEDLKNFLCDDMNLLHYTENIEQIKLDRDRARDSLAQKHVILSEAKESVEILKEGLLECRGKMIQVDQSERRKFEKKMAAIEDEKEDLSQRLIALTSRLEVITGERDVLQEAADNSGNRRRQHEAERERLLSEIAKHESSSSTAEEYAEKLEASERQKVDLETELAAFREKNADVTVEELKALLLEKETQLASTNEELDKIRETLSHVFSDLSLERSRTEELEIELNRSKATLLTTTKETSRLGEEFKQTTEKLTNLENDHKSVIISRDDLQQRLEEESAKLLEVERVVADGLDDTKQKSASSMRISELEDILKCTEAKVESGMKEEQRLVSMINVLHVEISTHKDQLSHILTLEQDLKESKESVSELQNELEQSQQVKEAVIEEKKRMTETIEALKQDVDTGSGRITELEGRMEESQHGESHVQIELSKKKTIIEAGIKEVNRLETICDQLDAELREEHDKGQQLEALLVEERLKVTEIEKNTVGIGERLDAETSRRTELEEENANQKRSIENGRIEEQRLEKICDDLESDLNDVTSRNASLQERLADESNKNKDLEERLTEESCKNKDLEERLGEESSRNNGLHERPYLVERREVDSECTVKKVEEFEEEVEKQKRTINFGKEEERRLEKICDELEAELNEEQNKNCVLQDRLTQIESKDNSTDEGGNEDLQKKIQGLEQENTTHKRTIGFGKGEERRLEKICDELEAELNEEQSKNCVLQDRLTQIESKDNGTDEGGNEDLQKKIQDLEQEITTHKRTIGYGKGEERRLEKICNELEAELDEGRLEKICDELEAELNEEQTKNCVLQDRLTQIESKDNSTDEGGNEDLQKKIQDLDKEITTLKRTIGYGKGEERRLEKICDELEAELNEEQTKTEELEKRLQMTFGRGDNWPSLSKSSSKDVDGLRKEIAQKELRITRHLGEENRLRTVLDKTKQDLSSERKRNEVLHHQIQSQLAGGANTSDERIDLKKLAAVEAKYKTSLEQKSKEVYKLKTELRRVSQMQDQSILPQPDSRPTSTGGATCTGSGITDDLAVYTLEAKNAHLVREMKELKSEYSTLKTKFSESSRKLIETMTELFHWKDKVEEMEKGVLAESGGAVLTGVENEQRTPPQSGRHFLSRSNADPSNPLYYLLPDDTGIATVDPSDPPRDAPSPCLQS